MGLFKKGEKGEKGEEKKESKKDEGKKSLPSVPSKTKTPSLPSKDKKPPPKVPTAASKDKKPAPTIPSKKDDDKKKDSEKKESSSSSKNDEKSDEKSSKSSSNSSSTKRPGTTRPSSTKSRKSATLTEQESLKAQVNNLETEVQRLRKYNAELEKQVNNAAVVESEQAKNLLSILARVNAAKDWTARVKALDPLLGVLAELKQFQATADSHVQGDAHAKRLAAFDAKLKKASPQDADKLTDEAAEIYAEFSKIEALEKKDDERLKELLDSVDSTLKPVAPKVVAPKQTPPYSISKVVTDFNAYKKDFELTVIPAHDKIAAIIAELEATLAQSARMNAVVEAAPEQFDTLFGNAKYFVDDRRARKADPEKGKLRSDFAAQLAALQSAKAHRAAAAASIAKRKALADKIKEAKKALRTQQRALEDLRDDGELEVGSAADQKKEAEVAASRAALAELEREDAALAETIEGHAPASGAAELAQRKLDETYTYEALADGVLKAKEIGSDADSVLKVTQKPDAADLGLQLALIGKLSHPNLVPVQTAFVDGPHLYVHTPYYAKGNLETWLKSKPDDKARARVAFGVLSGVAYIHSRGAHHGALRATAVLVEDDPTDESGVRAVINSYWNAATDLSADQFVAPEVAGGDAPTPASDVFSFGALLALIAGAPLERKALKDKVSVPKVKDKELAALLPQLLENEPKKRISALHALSHAYFAPQFATLDALKDSNKTLRSVRAALAKLSPKSLLSSDEIEKTLALVADPKLFIAPQRLALPTPPPPADAAAHAKDKLEAAAEKKDDAADDDDADAKDGAKKDGAEKKEKTKEATKPGSDADTLDKHEAVGKALLHAMLRQKPIVLKVAPVLLKYLLGVLPSSVRDLLRDLDLFDAVRARHYRQIRLSDDASALGLKMRDGSPVTNTNREAFLKEAIAHDLVDCRKPALDALRKGFFSVSGVKDEVRKLKTSEFAILLAGEDYLSGELVLNRVHQATSNEPFTAALRQLAADDLRRFLYASTGVPALPKLISNVVTVFTNDGDGKKASFSFTPQFSRVDVQNGDDLLAALGTSLAEVDKPLR